MKLQQALESGEFVFTGEIGPPKGTDLDAALEEAKEYYTDTVVAVNVTDLQSSVLRVGSMAVCHKLLDIGIEPIYQMTCRDRNRLALQSDLLSASVLGIENVLALTGDHVPLGDHPQAKSVFDIDSVQLLRVIEILRQGKDMTGNALSGIPKFFPGAVVSPCADPLEPQLFKMEKKINAGARFFQTQAVYDTSAFEKFMDQVRDFGVPVLVGIVLLKSAGMAKFMNENVAGVSVPDELIKELASVGKKDRKKKSVEIAARLLREMKNMCQGAHIMPLGWDSEVPKVIAAATA